MFEPGIGFWDPGSTCWPRDLFGVKNGSRKKWFCDGIILRWQFRGHSQTQMNSMVHSIHLGRLLCQKPWFLNSFTGISHFPGKLGRAPACYLPGPLPIPLGGPLPLCAQTLERHTGRELQTGCLHLSSWVPLQCLRKHGLRKDSGLQHEYVPRRPRGNEIGKGGKSQKSCENKARH